MSVWLVLVGLAAAEEPAALASVVRLVQDGHTCAGTVIDDAGTVLTAYHCVAGGRGVHVYTRSDAHHRGRVRGVDAARDLAVVVVPGLEGHPHTPLAVDLPAVGDEVWALGHPYGAALPLGYFAGTLRYSASRGVVSAVGERALQTTAPVNPGNSGGPLVTDDGVVGVVSRRLGRDGIGFASRVPDVDALQRYPAFGGQVELAPLVSLSSDDQGLFTLGGRVGLNLRERFALRASASVPFDSRWTALRSGRAHFVRAASHLALRQPILRGVAPVEVELRAGVAASTELVSEPSNLSFTRQTRALPSVGAAVHAVGFGVSVDVLYADGVATPILGVALLQPGVVSVF